MAYPSLFLFLVPRANLARSALGQDLQALDRNVLPVAEPPHSGRATGRRIYGPLLKAALAINAELKGATINYAKTRPVFEAYKASRYSKKFLVDHVRAKLARGSAGFGAGPNKRDFLGFGGNRNVENSQVYRHLHRLPFSA